MRILAVFGLGLAVTVAAASFAEAQERRPLRVDVQKRSYFDLGNVAPVGSMNRYATQHFTSSPQYAFAGDRFGEGALPPRIGAGVNPFANSFWTPGF
jgi:hypothetical protein